MTRNRRFFILRLFLCAVFSVLLTAYPTVPVFALPGENYFLAQYTQTLYNDDTNMISAEVNDIFQSSDGYIWIATYGGLIRYDGNDFTTVTAVKNGVLPQHSAMALCEGDDGAMWVGTNGNGIIVLSRDYNYAVISSDEGIPSSSVRSLKKAADGSIFAGTTNGICKISTDKKVTFFEETENLFIRDMAVCPDGDVFAVTEDGYFITVSADGKVNISQPGYSFCCLRLIDDSHLQAGTSSNQIISLSLENGRLSAVPHTVSGINSVNDIYEDANGRVWVVSDSGLGVIGPNYSIEIISNLAISSNLSKIIMDSDGSYWIGSDKYGLLKLVKSRFKDFSFEYNLPERMVNTIIKHDGAVLIGTDSGVQAVTHGKEFESELTRALDGVRVRCMMEDSHGNLRVCTYSEQIGVLTVTPGGSAYTLTTADGLASSKVRNITELSDGSFIIGTADGFSVSDGEKITASYGKEDGFTNGVVLCVCEGGDGTVYIGSDGGGIYEFRDGKVTSSDMNKDLSSGVILRMTYDDTSDILFVSTGNSLAYIKDGQTKTVKCDELPGNVFDIIITENRTVWLITTNSIFVSTVNELTSDEKPVKPSSIPKKYGLSSSVTSNSWHYLAEDGLLYLCCIKGVNVINTNDELSKPYVPKILLSGVEADGTVYYGTDSVKLSADASRMTVNFSVLNYIPSEGTELKYYLEGQDKDISTVSSSDFTSVSYTNLKGGIYRFHLIIPQSDGTEKDTVILTVNKTRGFWERPYVIIGVVIIALGTLFLLVEQFFRAREKAMLKRQEQLNEILRQAISAMTGAIDAKDAYTSGHSMRVADYSVKIARNMNMTEREIENLYYIALLHDVGKIGIPDRILSKPGRLDDEEFRIMKQHTTIGGKILSGITAIKDVSLGAQQHHEKWNGEGYTEGLAGENICLAARIICVADSFDAMASNRAYRNHLTKEQILGELTRCRGTQFDPDIDDIMIKMINDGELDEVFSE